MSNTDILVLAIGLLVSVWTISILVRRRALAFPIFLIAGIMFRGVIPKELEPLVTAASDVGFILLLFSLGIVVDLKWGRELLPAGRTAGWLFLAQAAAIAPVAVMVLLELLSILLLSITIPLLESNGAIGPAVMKLAKTAIIITCLFVFKEVIVRLIKWFDHLRQSGSEGEEKIGIHAFGILVIVIGVCQLADHFGLAGGKAGFILGLFISGEVRKGGRLHGLPETIRAPKRLTTPFFFLFLGLLTPGEELFTPIGFYAALSALVAAIACVAIHLRWSSLGGSWRAALLTLPCMSIVGLAGKALVRMDRVGPLFTYLMLTGLLMTVGAVILLPKDKEGPSTGGH